MEADEWRGSVVASAVVVHDTFLIFNSFHLQEFQHSSLMAGDAGNEFYADSDDDISFVDDDDVVSDVVRRDGHDDQSDGKWTFVARSTRASQVFDGLNKRVAAGDFKLVYKPVDSHLLDKMNKEVRHLLSRGRVKLHGCNDGQAVPDFDAFACALPPSFMLNLKTWILTADDVVTALLATFDTIIAFLVREINMPIYQISSVELPDFDMANGTQSDTQLLGRP